MTEPTDIETTERAWDPLVRLTHWAIAAAVLINGIVTDGGSVVHVWIGYSAFAVLGLRLIWGFIGPDEARFSAFPWSLSRAKTHLVEMMAGRHHRYRSHNPLGTLMVYSLWGLILMMCTTGVMMENKLFPETGQVVQSVEQDHAGDEHDGETGRRRKDYGLLGDIHEVGGNLLLILAALHVAGVALESRLTGTNLAREMLTGERTVRGRG